ncbi:hypothetical protein VNO78_27039 [Psophocarpus tetragonolobus]|uniref:Uncharacterized protein n=1 Tax=Psophocarpus tetragonolobus TaxID=3891 RepID=A0AAN9S028_PSOTE
MISCSVAKPPLLVDGKDTETNPIAQPALDPLRETASGFAANGSNNDRNNGVIKRADSVRDNGSKATIKDETYAIYGLWIMVTNRKLRSHARGLAIPRGSTLNSNTGQHIESHFITLQDVHGISQ